MRLRTAALLVTATVLLVATGVGYSLLHHVQRLLQPEGCTATVDGRTVTLSTEQAENAALIAALAVRRGLPARAVTIALATAYQESKLYNLEEGDRDSLGLFQQRPSQGWGTRAEVLDPVHATNAFYTALERLDGYTTMPVTQAAQAVQRSQYPEAYADHEADARVLASALTGNSPAALQCAVDADVPTGRRTLNGAGLTPRAATVRRELQGVFGDLSLGGFAPGGVTSGHMAGSAHYEGRAVDVFVRPVNRGNRITGWAIAQYLVAQADRLRVRTVIFDGRIWRAGTSGQWRDYTPSDRPGSSAVLMHRDHVHVDVWP